MQTDCTGNEVACTSVTKYYQHVFRHCGRSGTEAVLTHDQHCPKSPCPPLPLNIFEDKLAQLEVPQDDAIDMTVTDGRHDLAEQGPRFAFTKALLLPHIGVEVAVALGEEDIGFGLSQDDLLAGGNVLMGIHLPVWRQGVPVLVQREHLHTGKSHAHCSVINREQTATTNSK